MARVEVVLKSARGSTEWRVDSVSLYFGPDSKLREAKLIKDDTTVFEVPGHGLSELRSIDGKVPVYVFGPGDMRQGPIEGDWVKNEYPSVTQAVVGSSLPQQELWFIVQVLDGQTEIWRKEVKFSS